MKIIDVTTAKDDTGRVTPVEVLDARGVRRGTRASTVRARSVPMPPPPDPRVDLARKIASATRRRTTARGKIDGAMDVLMQALIERMVGA